MGSLDFSLYLITDRHQARGGDLPAVVEEALAGGVRCVQLREKDLPPSELLALARHLREMTARHGALLLINDRIDVALAVGADGVHLGETALPADIARQLLGPERLIGVSCHDRQGALAAAEKGADFITFGPVYHTPSKAAYGKPVGIGRLADVARSLPIPVFALGGVKGEQIPELLAAGAAGIALISAVIAAEEPQEQTRLLISLLQSLRREANPIQLRNSG